MTTDTELPRHSDHITIARPPDEVYAMVSDVTRMGEWSPVCKACWWDDGDSARVGAWFTGRNEQPERTWETRCEVIAADPGREFTFLVGGTESPFARWSYTFAAVDDGTELTESWAGDAGARRPLRRELRRRRSRRARRTHRDRALRHGRHARRDQGRSGAQLSRAPRGVIEVDEPDHPYGVMRPGTSRVTLRWTSRSKNGTHHVRCIAR